MARYRLTPIARSDLLEIASFTDEKWGPSQRKKYIKALVECFGLIATQPNMGRSRPEVGSDVRSVGYKNHIIFYRKLGPQAEILRVLHGARDINL